MDGENNPRHTASAKQIVQLLASESNAHGVARIAKARSTKRRVFWACLVLLGLSAATVQMVSLLRKYFSYPTVEISVKSSKLPVRFPAVTLCNNNPISLTKVNEMLVNKSDFPAWFSFLQDANLGKHKSRLDSHQAFYENFPEAAKYVGHSFNDLVVSCRFKNEACGRQNFSLFFDGKDYFHCYTFTGTGNADRDVRKVSDKPHLNKAGPHNGLSLILSVSSQKIPPGAYGIYDTQNPMAYGSGVRVEIHEPNTMPTPAHHGFDVPPGYSTSVGLKTNVHKRLSTPYEQCTTKTSKGQQDFKSTMFSCLQLCKQKILKEECGCVTAALPTLDTVEDTDFCAEVKKWKDIDVKNNLTIDLPTLNCEQEVMKKLHEDRSYESKCDCAEPCTEVLYEQTMSMSYWPEEFYQFSLLNNLYKDINTSTEAVREALETLIYITSRYGADKQGEFSEEDHGKVSRASAIIRKNFVRLNIYFQDLSVTEHIQLPAYDFVSLMADIGGILILWMGISVLTLFEIFELVMALIFLLCNSDTYVMGEKRYRVKHDE